MRPETCEAFRARVITKARALITDVLISGEVVVNAKNGPATALPDVDTVARNGEVRSAWARTAAAHGVELMDRIVSTRLKIDLYQVVSVRFPQADALLSFLGEPWMSVGREVDGFTTDFTELRTADVIRSLLSADITDLRILRALCEWRSMTSTDEMAALMLREISVQGMSTKWMEQNAAIILKVFGVIGWTVSETGSLSERLGLDDPDKSLVHVRVHPDDAQRLGLWPQFCVPSTLFMTLPFTPQSVLIVENKTTFRRVSVDPGCVVIWGSGHAIVAMAGRMDWLRAVDDVRYWGDCDGAGYLILDRLRSVLPGMVSVNMTLPEILPHIGKAIKETQGEAVRTVMPNLTPDETAARIYLHDRQLRLEQEFVPDASSSAHP